jgi:ubiquinone/menaquinone biosynthesis C-methylase UbiE
MGSDLGSYCHDAGMTDPTDVFTGRVQNYLNTRPGYPLALLDLLRKECLFSQAAVVIDVGFGTGLLSELFLAHGNPVFGVEPNSEMRIAGENRLRHYPGFVSTAARAEATTLPDCIGDFITASQAFHWFQPEPTRVEFERILKPGGWVVVVENIGRVDTPFMAAYHQFNKTYLGEKDSEPEDLERYRRFFGHGRFTEKLLKGVSQHADFNGLTGRVLSRAAAPEIGHPRYAKMIDALRAIFDHYQQNGEVVMAYHTDVVYGQFPTP